MSYHQNQTAKVQERFFQKNQQAGLTSHDADQKLSQQKSNIDLVHCDSVFDHKRSIDKQNNLDHTAVDIAVPRKGMSFNTTRLLNMADYYSTELEIRSPTDFILSETTFCTPRKTPLVTRIPQSPDFHIPEIMLQTTPSLPESYINCFEYN